MRVFRLPSYAACRLRVPFSVVRSSLVRPAVRPGHFGPPVTRRREAESAGCVPPLLTPREGLGSTNKGFVEGEAQEQALTLLDEEEEEVPEVEGGIGRILNSFSVFESFFFFFFLRFFLSLLFSAAKERGGEGRREREKEETQKTKGWETHRQSRKCKNSDCSKAKNIYSNR